MAGGEHEYFQLRAEWLRFKSHVFDSNTDLPTLDAAMEDVRRLLEERSALGVVFFDLGGNGQFESLHGWQAFDEILRAVASGLDGLREQGLLGPRDVVAPLGVRSDKFVVFVAGGGDDHAGRDLGVVAGRLRDALATVLRERLGARLGGSLGLFSGHASLYRDPMLRAERAIHRALDQAMQVSFRARVREEDASARELGEIIEGERTTSYFQPILELASGAVLGHEVFTRGPRGSALEDPERLFGVAERVGRGAELERLARRRALALQACHLPPGAQLFLNTSAEALAEPALGSAALLRELQTAGFPATRLVLEIAERATVAGRRPRRELLRELKRSGIRIAIDDMGAGYASLQSLVELEPDYLKFDIALVRDIDRFLIKRSLLETLVELAQKIGAEVIAEGVEAENELTALRELGVRLGQGRHLAPPRPVTSGDER